MNKTKYWILGSIVFLTALAAYAVMMYVYVENRFAPLALLTEPQKTTLPSVWKPAKQLLFLHQVNTPNRAKRKENRFDGYEVDILVSAEGEVLVGHDEKDLSKKITLSDIWSAMKNPADKFYWLDLKTELSDTQLDEIVGHAKTFGIRPENLFFESLPNDTAKKISKKGLILMLQLMNGFNEDENSITKRQAINLALQTQWQEYKPAAVTASFGKYAALKSYFPNAAKAIYYSATVRPTLKKTFMKKSMKADDSVKIFMLDEYTFL